MGITVRMSPVVEESKLWIHKLFPPNTMKVATLGKKSALGPMIC